MQLIDGKPVYAATDLVGFLACEHRLALERAAMLGLVAKPFRNDPSIDIVAKRGDQHERNYLEALRESGSRVVEIHKDGSKVQPLDGTPEAEPAARDPGADLRAAQDETIEAMRAGADVVYQATFFDGTWRGHADFLLRREHAPGEPDSAFGPWHYEVADTKLARHVKASAILQVCSYVELLTAIQGRQPEFLHLVLGGKQRLRERLRVDDFMAYYRRVKGDFEAAVGVRGEGRPVVYPPEGTYPEPNDHCEVCRWVVACKAKRRQDDHLSLVAWASRRQRDALAAKDVGTRGALARLELPMASKPDGIGEVTLARLHNQARLQVASDGLKPPLFERLPLERDKEGAIVPNRGLLGLPAPSPGDLFLDLEGDPYALDDGIDYLFGLLEPAVAEDDARLAALPLPPQLDPVPRHVPKFHGFWSLDAAGSVTAAAERAAFECTVDFIVERRARDPGMHVYHYAPYEPTAFGRLAQRYGTREEEVDQLFRDDVLVDLFRVVRQSVRVGVESYSIKRLEPLYGLDRAIDLKDAGSSIVAFEGWLELGADEAAAQGPAILQQIADYNRDDVVSTLALRDWLEAQRSALERDMGAALPRPGTPARDGEDAPEPSEARKAALELVARLTADAKDDPAERAEDPPGAARWLMAQLVEWHRREDKAAWWRFFDLMDMTDEQLFDEKEPVAFLQTLGEPVLARTGTETQLFAYPEQEHDISPGTEVFDPRRDPDDTGAAGTVVAVDRAMRTLMLKRPKARVGSPMPTALVPRDILPTWNLVSSLHRTGAWIADHGVDGADAPLLAARRLLQRIPPAPDASHPESLRAADESALDAAVRLGLALDGEVLPIQGPPGSGKTYTGAHMIVALARAGKRVGVTANSHKVIGNLLDGVAAADAKTRRPGDRPVRIGQKPKRDATPTSARALPLASNADVEAALRGGDVDVVGAVAWTWCLEQMAAPEPILDVLFVDEAGQMSLANVMACAPAARSIVLLGDPQQLDQPTQGSHPPGAERSALGHLLRDPAGLQPDRATIAPHEGLFLDRTWRLHPDLCDYTSHAFYEGRLLPVDGLERQLVVGGETLSGTGVRMVSVPHHGHETASPEEGASVVALIRELLDARATWFDIDGEEHTLDTSGVIVVAPYNDHVAQIELALAEARIEGVAVGTVDKFQGQERPVSIYAMGTSAPELAPRGLEFLYSTNRLNVATSRARAVAAVVCSPALLRVACHTPRQMRLVNALCLAAEATKDARMR
jgi:uncharacterized protein